MADPSLRAAIDARAPERGLWSDEARMVLLLLNALGLTCGVVAVWMLAGEPSTDDQSLWLHVAFSGILTCGSGNGLWLAWGRRSLRQARRTVAEAAALAGGGRAVPSLAAGFVAVRDGTRFHRPDCPLVGTKATVPHRRGDGRIGCEVCRP